MNVLERLANMNFETGFVMVGIVLLFAFIALSWDR